MRRFVLLALLVAAPTSAQFVGKPAYEPVGVPNPFLGDGALAPPPVGREMRNVRQDIARARDAGHLSRREALSLFRETRRIDALARRYGTHGLSGAEQKELHTRALAVRDAVSRP